MRPQACGGGEAAVGEVERRAVAGAEPFALAIVDAHLPGPDGFSLAERWAGQGWPAGRVVLLLSAADRNDTSALCREIGVTGHLTKPVKESSLRESILAALVPGRAGAAHPSRDAGADRDDRRADRKEAPLRILLVDDHEFNRRVGTHKLEGWGHSVVTATGGREALDLLARQAFDLALIDIQMADMDGLELTASVRRREAEAGGHLPIIAMTAWAMSGDRETCLAAGMDAYVTKPIRDRELAQAIRAVVPVRGRQSANPAADPLAVPEAIDSLAVKERTGGDERLVRELADVFRGDTPRLMAEIDAAIRDGNANRLDHAAHSLKAMLGFFHLSAATSSAAALESLGRRGDLGPAESEFRTLTLEIERAWPLLNALTESLIP
jgi:CheY-like chemotaxis protein/HPt (histidine-containing phosphotransfer) domain-containing protein